MKGDTAKKIVTGLVAAAALLLLLYSAREYGFAMYAEAVTRRGVREFESGDAARAEKLFREAVRANPKYAGAWLNLGMAAETRGKYDTAIEAYGKAVELARDEDAVKTARLRMAAIMGDRRIEPPQRQRGWYDRAVEQYELLIEAEPDNPEYHLGLGFSAFGAGRAGLGLDGMREASRLADGPEYKWIHGELLMFYQGANLVGEAERELEIIESFSEEPGEPVENDGE